MTSDHNRLERARRRMIRYRILKILDAGRPLSTGEGMLRDILVDVDLQATQNDVRMALQYLCDKSYIDLKTDDQVWMSRLLPVGVDFLEDPKATDTGIARPSRY